MRKIGQKNITGYIYLKSGLRIGGSEEMLKAGATDLTVIKHPVTLDPYLPGSSFKGKLRSELEKKDGKFSGKKGNEPCDCGALQKDCLICRIFGTHKPKSENNLGPTRIIVRDAKLVRGGEIETKTENIIDRKDGKALHPRKVERVSEGSEFEFKISLQVWDLDANCAYNGKQGGDALIEFVKDGMREVQNTGLGGGLSKGYGEIEFRELKLDGEGFTL